MAKRPVKEASNNKAERSILFAVLFHLYIKLMARLPHCHLKRPAMDMRNWTAAATGFTSAARQLFKTFQTIKTKYMCFFDVEITSVLRFCIQVRGFICDSSWIYRRIVRIIIIIVAVWSIPSHRIESYMLYFCWFWVLFVQKHHLTGP